MDMRISQTAREVASAAAQHAAESLKRYIEKRGRATFIAATGASQIDFLEALVETPGVDWSRTTMFHLDEYVGIPDTHPASFRRYLRERLIEPAGITDVTLIHGDSPDLDSHLANLNAAISRYSVDIAFIGIGENGHIAFNDPPADFDTEEPYIVVELDDACRRQQVNEGWFPTLDDVPRRAVTMTIRRVLASAEIICTVPGSRKADAVAMCLGPGRPISPAFPASILRSHSNTTVYLDGESAERLPERLS